MPKKVRSRARAKVGAIDSPLRKQDPEQEKMEPENNSFVIEKKVAGFAKPAGAQRCSQPREPKHRMNTNSSMLITSCRGIS